MFDTISSFGNPNGKAFGVLGETISSDQGKVYIKSGSNTLNAGWVELGLAPTPTMTPTPSITPSPTVTPTKTPTPTPTPTPSSIAPGMYISSYSSPQDVQVYVSTNSSSWTSGSHWKLRFKDTGIPWPGQYSPYEQLADSWNANPAPISMRTVGQHRAEIYVVRYNPIQQNQTGLYQGMFVGPKTYVTMSILPATTFVAPAAPGTKTYLSSLSFPMDNPAYLYCGNGYFTSSGGLYKLRCKLGGSDTFYINGHDGLTADPEGTHRANHWNNSYSAIFPLGPGNWSASLYAVRYNAAGGSISQSFGTPDENTVNFTVTPQSTFSPETAPAYDGGVTSNVYLSGEKTVGATKVVTWYKADSPPPYIYTTDPTVLASTGYKLRAKWTTPSASDREHLAVGMQNQYGWLLPVDAGTYTLELYWVKYPSATNDGTSIGNSASVARLVTLIVI